MPCKLLIDKNGKACGFACSRTERKQEACYICGKPATKLCDYRNGLETCDRPLCDSCACHIGKDTDYCPEHSGEFTQKLTGRANKRLGLEEVNKYSENND